MKNLTKLALVSAMAISANAMAAQLQSLDDAELSAATGQDGITINLSSGVTFDYLAIHDADGLIDANVNLSGDAGAIVIGDTTAGSGAFSISPAGGINVVIDADGNAGAPVLNVGLNLGTTIIQVGTIQVAESTGAGAITGAVADAITIGDITLNDLNVNIQLGNQAQGALIKLDSDITGGLQIASLGLVSTATANSTGITLSDLVVTSNGSADLALNLLIDATNTGLTIGGLTALDVAASDVDLGNGTSIGALYISNLDVGTITVAGH